MQQNYSISFKKRFIKDAIIILLGIIVLLLKFDTVVLAMYLLVGLMASYSIFYNFKNRTTFLINKDEIAIKYPFYRRKFLLDKYNNFQIKDFIYKRIIANEINTGKVVTIVTNTYENSLEDILKSIIDFKDIDNK